MTITAIPTFGFARGAIVRRTSGGPNMLVVRDLAETVCVVRCEGDEAGTLRLREEPKHDLVQVLDHDGRSQLAAEIAPLRAQLEKLEAEKEAGGFWRGVFDSITDKTDREKIEAELSDYHFVMQQVPDVYMHITGGKMSKCNYYAHAVIAEADEYSEKFTNKAADEARRNAIEECAAIADRWTSPEQRLHGHGGPATEMRALVSENQK